MNVKLPELQQFLGAYFNQDWMCEHKTADDVIRAFLSETSSETLLIVKQEINELLLMNKDEVELRRFLLKEMSCCYCYWHEWPSGTSWLQHVVGFI